jgi:hypothetical protein
MCHQFGIFWMDEIQFTGPNLGRVLCSRSSYICAMNLCYSGAKQPNLNLKTRHKQLLGSLQLVLAFRSRWRRRRNGRSFLRWKWNDFDRHEEATRVAISEDHAMQDCYYCASSNKPTAELNKNFLRTSYGRFLENKFTFITKLQHKKYCSFAY